MPLTKIQIEALRTIAAARDPESYVAGSTPINRFAGRFSTDIDIFHDNEQAAALAADRDAAALEAAGFNVQWLRRSGAVHTLVAARNQESVKLDWVADSDFRFFPTISDEVFGFTLHPVDLALNKILAAGNRRELRDLIDLVEIDRTILPLGALVWAAVEKAPGFTPEGLIAEIRRNSIHPAEEWRSLDVAAAIDPVATMSNLRAALDRADDFVRNMPTEKAGLLFLSGGDVVQPDPAKLADYVAHAGRRRGHWPTNAKIAEEMQARIRRS